MSSERQPVHTGGCQCGAVRFRVEGALGEASICHCRMCQKATAGPFGFFVRVDGGDVTWTRGAPKYFASSNVARRGFCSECGTPLTWEYQDGLDLTVISFDEPAKIEPVVQLASDQRYSWLMRLHSMPERTPSGDAEYAAYLASVVSYQHPDHDTAAWPPQEASR